MATILLIALLLTSYESFNLMLLLIFTYDAKIYIYIYIYIYLKQKLKKEEVEIGFDDDFLLNKSTYTQTSNLSHQINFSVKLVIKVNRQTQLFL